MSTSHYQMATLSSELVFSLFLFSIFSFSIPTTASICPPTRCLGGPPIRFPFRLRNSQPSRCGYNPDFDLSCNQSFLTTVLTLPVPNDYLVVERIDYEFQTIYVNDPNLCLPRRFLDQTLDLNGTPFRLGSSQKFTFLNCSTQALLEQQGTSFPVVTTSVSCLSTENHTVFAVPSFAYENWLRKTSSPAPSAPASAELSCSVISSVLVPTAAAHELQDMFGNLGGGVGLTWSTPDCGDCEANGGDCGFDGDTNRIVCSGTPTATKNGIPRSAKYGLIIGAGIPGLLCILGIASFIWGRIHAYGRGHQPTIDLSTTTSRQPAILIVGLDGPTIESYPKTLLGESKRLPKPNDNTCSICLCEYQPKEVLRTIPECNHYFHAGCIDEWLKLNATCPMCRNSPDGSSLGSVTPSSSTSSSTTSLASS